MLQLVGVKKTYGAVRALDGIDLDAPPGEIVALTGPSGAGKTTTLHVAAGILQSDAGTVRLNDRDVGPVPAWKRDVALMQETYALYPHITALENITFPLRSPLERNRLSDEELRSRAQKVAEMLEIDSLLEKQIQHLSGGQRQRVALARALVREPQFFLLDEPIAHLDARLRHWLRGELRRQLTSKGCPCIWATPDGKEALSVGDRVAVIVNGRILQVGSPREIFSRPATARVAEIVSDPPIGLMPAVVEQPGPRLRIEGLPAPLHLSVDGGANLEGGEVVVGIRPSSLHLGNGSQAVAVPAKVLARELTTRETIVSVRLGEHTLRVLADPFSEFRADETVTLDWEGARVYLFGTGGDRGLICEARIVRPA